MGGAVGNCALVVDCGGMEILNRLDRDGMVSIGVR